VAATPSSTSDDAAERASLAEDVSSKKVVEECAEAPSSTNRSIHNAFGQKLPN
jgi:hypothetical protein